MAGRGARWAGALALLLLTGAGARFYFSQTPHSAPHASNGLPWVTPPGITLQIKIGSERARIEAAPRVYYADDQGRTLYVRGGDGAPDTLPTCSGECAATWPAALAPRAAEAQGDWSVAAREDGSRQWRVHGAPLHRYAGDAAAGDVDGEERGAGVWQPAVARPGSGLALPAGVQVQEIDDAAGWALVEHRGRTLYTRRAAAPTCDSSHPCARLWQPLEAPAIAAMVGDFQALPRDDGITQWTYRHEALYTYEGDRHPGDVTGVDVDPAFQVALVARLFMPADAVIRRTLEFGTLLSTKDSRTLYQRDRVTAGEERHEFRSDHGPPALGRYYGVSTCDATCARDWPPYAAPADAVPQGYWSVLTRADGSRQWTYKGFALYTYAHEQPGELRGNRRYAFAAVAEHPTASQPPAAEAATDIFAAPPGAGAGLGLGALFWHAVIP